MVTVWFSRRIGNEEHDILDPKSCEAGASLRSECSRRIGKEEHDIHEPKSSEVDVEVELLGIAENRVRRC
eukprot:1811416-Amphidinium_carterae.2